MSYCSFSIINKMKVYSPFSVSQNYRDFILFSRYHKQAKRRRNLQLGQEEKNKEYLYCEDVLCVGSCSLQKRSRILSRLTTRGSYHISTASEWSPSLHGNRIKNHRWVSYCRHDGWFPSIFVTLRCISVPGSLLTFSTIQRCKAELANLFVKVCCSLAKNKPPRFVSWTFCNGMFGNCTFCGCAYRGALHFFNELRKLKENSQIVSVSMTYHLRRVIDLSLWKMWEK
jgi:hypothetical protein